MYNISVLDLRGDKMNTSDRNPNSVAQTGVNQVVLATPIASLVGVWLSATYPPEVVAPAVALTMAGVTTLGTILRNIIKEKGWTKYIG
jgi:hypothetical protein